MELDLDITYVLVIALFLLPVLLLNALVFRPFLKLFEERHDKLEGATERAKRMLDEAEHKADAFREQIRKATAEGVARRNQLRQEARDRMDARITAEKTTLQGRLDGALAEIEDARRTAMGQVESDAGRLAEETAAKLLGRALA
ncbi:MAG: ATP synthase F0 subunit B [Myxococcales bacterium]|nr:ATP synthase F0 subunit B [Myxococcales bacterium]